LAKICHTSVIKEELGGGVNMIKILISSVGMHDPFGYKIEGVPTEGPIIGAVKELKPDIVFLFPTSKTFFNYLCKC
jgi:hypothetical protein